MNNLLLVGAGGAVGSMLRYLCQRGINFRFPYGTLGVNILGCFVIGVLWALSLKGLNEKAAVFLATGVCGGFTTFSAFSLESTQMLFENRWIPFALYFIMSVLGGLLATFAGYKLALAS